MMQPYSVSLASLRPMLRPPARRHAHRCRAFRHVRRAPRPRRVDRIAGRGQRDRRLAAVSQFLVDGHRARDAGDDFSRP